MHDKNIFTPPQLNALIKLQTEMKFPDEDEKIERLLAVVHPEATKKGTCHLVLFLIDSKPHSAYFDDGGEFGVPRLVTEGERPRPVTTVWDWRTDGSL